MTIETDSNPYAAFVGALFDVVLARPDFESSVIALDGARQDFAQALTRPSLLSAIAWQAGLDQDEAEVLALLLECETDPARRRDLAECQGDTVGNAPTLATIRRLFPEPHRGALALAPDARLRRAELCEVVGAGAWQTRAAAVAQSVVWSVLGDTSLDPDLPTGVRFAPAAGAAAGVAPVVFVTGSDRETRLAGVAMTLPVRGVLATSCPQTRAQWQAVVREATLRSVGVVIELADEFPPEARHYIERADHLAWGVSSLHELPLESLPSRPWQEITAPVGTAHPEEWVASLGVAAPPGYSLDREQLRLVAMASQGRDVVGAVRRLAGGHLDRLTTRIHPRRTWTDLVLPPGPAEQVRLIAERYRYRTTIYDEWGFPAFPSAGVVALFGGPSGTGKTLTAEIIAGELGLDLFKLDLSSVVSKYIGETEKNLEAVFRAAEAGEGVLLFDEADAVFGKRSEVKDARDRYANIESAYLLQRLERSDALVIMATNLPGNIDAAFLRRVHVSVDFSVPGEAERRRLWELAFPRGCPRDGLDLDRLAAAIELPGGPITNVALGAAFRAAAVGTPVTMREVVQALRAELRKMGRVANEATMVGLYAEPTAVEAVQ